MNAYILYAVRLNKLYHSFFLESLRLLIEVERIIVILFRMSNHFRKSFIHSIVMNQILYYLQLKTFSMDIGTFG